MINSSLCEEEEEDEGAERQKNGDSGENTEHIQSILDSVFPAFPLPLQLLVFSEPQFRFPFLFFNSLPPFHGFTQNPGALLPVQMLPFHVQNLHTHLSNAHFHPILFFLAANHHHRALYHLRSRPRPPVAAHHRRVLYLYLAG